MCDGLVSRVTDWPESSPWSVTSTTLFLSLNHLSDGLESASVFWKKSIHVCICNINPVLSPTRLLKTILGASLLSLKASVLLVPQTVFLSFCSIFFCGKAG